MNKKRVERGLIFTRVPRECDVALWPRGRATRAHTSACVARGVTRRLYLYLHIYFDYSTYSLSLIGRDLLTLITATRYKPVDFPKFTPFGTKPPYFM